MESFSLTIGDVSRLTPSIYNVENVENGRLWTHSSGSSLPELLYFILVGRISFSEPTNVEIGADSVARYHKADDLEALLLSVPHSPRKCPFLLTVASRKVKPINILNDMTHMVLRQAKEKLRRTRNGLTRTSNIAHTAESISPTAHIYHPGPRRCRLINRLLPSDSN